MFVRKRRTKRSKVLWENSGYLKSRVSKLIELCQFDHINRDQIFCFESSNAKTCAYARIWGLNRLWQQTLGLSPAYILEVVSERFNKLSLPEQDHILIHELLHIPKNFSGALVSHRRKGGVNERVVREIYEALHPSR